MCEDAHQKMINVAMRTKCRWSSAQTTGAATRRASPAEDFRCQVCQGRLQHEFLLIGCDGLWDTVSYEQAGKGSGAWAPGGVGPGMPRALQLCSFASVFVVECSVP